MTDATTTAMSKPNGAGAHRIQPVLAERSANGRFGAGNPGKPRGSRHKLTVLAEQLMAADAEAIIRKVIEMAKAGDLGACKLVLDRILPAPKSRPVEVPLVGDHDGANTIIKNYSAVVAAVAAGQVSPAEGLELFALIGQHHAALSELAPHRLTAKEFWARLNADCNAELQRRQAARMTDTLAQLQQAADEQPDCEAQQ